MLLIKHDYPSAVGDLIAGGATWLLVRRGPRRIGLSSNLARARLWWLRRRYKVLEGGKSKSEKRWMN